MPIEKIATNSSMTTIEGVRPHISLAVCNSSISEEMKKVFDSNFNASAFRIQFDAVGCFPTTGALFLSPTWSTSLRMIHEEVNGTLRSLGIPVNPY